MGTLGRKVVWTTGVLVLISLVSLVPQARAGCLLAYDDCAACSQRSLWEGMKSFSLSKIRRANLELADCVIDLYHCLLLGKAHSYPCAA